MDDELKKQLVGTDLSLDTAIRCHVKDVIDWHDGHIINAAKALGIGRTTMFAGYGNGSTNKQMKTDQHSTAAVLDQKQQPEVPDQALCPHCKKTLELSHAIGNLGDSNIAVATFWCFQCKVLIHFQFLGMTQAQETIHTAKPGMVF